MIETAQDTSKAANQDATTTLLVVDDDVRIRSLLATSLGSRGYHVLTASSAVEMKRVMADGPVDLVILDVMMPGEDGLSACKRLEEDGGPPVILLTALGDEENRILGIESGADRYLPKPCSSREVLAHVQSVLRKRQKLPEQTRPVFHFLGFRADMNTRELLNPDGAIVDLSQGEFSVLRAFLERPRRILSRAELLTLARGSDSESFDRAVDIQISRLRKKLKADEDLIRTVRNEGYMFVAKVTTVARDGAEQR